MEERRWRRRRSRSKCHKQAINPSGNQAISRSITPNVSCRRHSTTTQHSMAWQDGTALSLLLSLLSLSLHPRLPPPLSAAKQDKTRTSGSGRGSCTVPAGPASPLPCWRLDPGLKDPELENQAQGTREPHRGATEGHQRPHPERAAANARPARHEITVWCSAVACTGQAGRFVGDILLHSPSYSLHRRFIRFDCSFH